METKVQQLTDMANKKPILRFNGNKFREYVKSTPRNYSVIVIFTAMAPSRQCAICRNVHDEFSIVASSFRYSQAYSNELFFVMVDFDEGSDVFQLVSVLYFYFSPINKTLKAVCYRTTSLFISSIKKYRILLIMHVLVFL